MSWDLTFGFEGEVRSSLSMEEFLQKYDEFTAEVAKKDLERDKELPDWTRRCAPYLVEYRQYWKQTEKKTAFYVEVEDPEGRWDAMDELAEFISQVMEGNGWVLLELSNYEGNSGWFITKDKVEDVHYLAMVGGESMEKRIEALRYADTQIGEERYI
jgi:hypothetical protein